MVYPCIKTLIVLLAFQIKEYKSIFLIKNLSAFHAILHHLSVRNNCSRIRHLERHRTDFIAYGNRLLCLLRTNKIIIYFIMIFHRLWNYAFLFNPAKILTISAPYILIFQNLQLFFPQCDGCCTGLYNPTTSVLSFSRCYIHCISQHELTIQILNIAPW